MTGDRQDGTWTLLLFQEGPHPDIPPGDRLFEPFIGSWDLVVSWYERDAVTRTELGEWHFGWVLEGRAVQEVWIVPRRDLRVPGIAPVRVRDKPPVPRPVHRWLALGVDRSDAANGQDLRSPPSRRRHRAATALEDGRPMTWTFSEITAASFVWTNATQEPNGHWAVTQRFAATRAREVGP